MTKSAAQAKYRVNGSNQRDSGRLWLPRQLAA